MKKNIKTVNRLFTVFGVALTVLIIQIAVTPLTFAAEHSFTVRQTTPYKLPIDSSFPYVNSYFYGANSAIVDFKGSDNKWVRVIFNNNTTICNSIKDGSTYGIGFTANSNADNDLCIIYWYLIGYTYSSNTSFRSSTWCYSYLSVGNTTYFDLNSDIYINSANAPIYPVDISVTHCDFNSYYPFVPSSGSSSGGSVDVDLSPVLDNQSTIISKIDRNQSQLLQSMSQIYWNVDQAELALKREISSVHGQINYRLNSVASNQESAANSRADQQRSEANSRQSQIMDAGSDVTVSTIDNWVAGENGLAGKLTNLAATLSSNAAIFSQNQSENQANLQRAGDFVKGVFDEIPTGIIGACLCFLIMLIAVKVVGR